MSKICAKKTRAVRVRVASTQSLQLLTHSSKQLLLLETSDLEHPVTVETAAM